MSALEDYLRMLQARRLQSARDDTLSLAPEKGVLREAEPPGPNAPQPTGVAGETAPVVALMQAYQAYLQRSGRSRDPLLDSTRRTRLGGGQTQIDEVAPATLRLGPGGEPFGTTAHGPRAGRTRQVYVRPDGRKVSVYYDERGRRKAFVWGAPSGGPPKGVRR